MEHVTAAIDSLPRQLPHVEPHPQRKFSGTVLWSSHVGQLYDPWWSNIFWFLSGTVTDVLFHNFSYYVPIVTHLSTHYAESGSYSMQHLVSTHFGLVCLLLVHPSWEPWPLLHHTVQERTLDINHFRSVKFGIWMCFVLLSSYIILLYLQVMILCGDNVPLPKYYIGQYVTVWDRNQTSFHFLCILITVPHPKHCSVELLFPPKMKLAENMLWLVKLFPDCLTPVVYVFILKTLIFL